MNLRSKLIRIASDNRDLRPAILPLVRTATIDEKEIFSPGMDIHTKKGMDAWVLLMRMYTLDSEPGSPERLRRMEESKKSLGYAGFLLRKRPIGKAYAEAAKSTDNWRDTISD
jgi:hypothetical protein